MARLAFAWFSSAAFALSLLYFLYEYMFSFGAADSAAAAASPALSLSVNLLLFTCFAAHHSVFARTPVKRLITSVVTPTLERAVYTLVASLLFTLVIRFWRHLPGIAWQLDGVWRWPGYALQLAGIVLTIVAARRLGVWELSGLRQASGRTAAPAHLQTHGLYGLVRHPLYFAWVLLVFGAPEMTMTRLSFAVISSVYLAAAIPIEERDLVETFGASYASYRKKVRWRMLPGIY